MKLTIIYLLIYSFMIINSSSLSAGESLKKSSLYEQSLSSEQVLDIAETTFRYLFKKNASAQQQKAPQYFLSLFGSNPTETFLKRFAGHTPSVHNGSEFEEGKGLHFKVTQIKRITEDKVEISGGYYEAGLSSSGNIFIVERKQGKWFVKTGKELRLLKVFQPVLIVSQIVHRIANSTIYCNLL